MVLVVVCYPICQIKSVLFILPTNDNLPQGALQSAQHMTLSVLRPSNRIGKNSHQKNL